MQRHAVCCQMVVEVGDALRSVHLGKYVQHEHILRCSLPFVLGGGGGQHLNPLRDYHAAAVMHGVTMEPHVRAVPRCQKPSSARRHVRREARHIDLCLRDIGSFGNGLDEVGAHIVDIVLKGRLADIGEGDHQGYALRVRALVPRHANALEQGRAASR